MFFDNSVMFPSFFQFLLRLDKSLPDVKIQFILNPLAFPEIMDILDLHGQPLHDHIMYLTRTYAYYIYRQKQILLGHWKSDSIFAKKNKNYHINSINTSTNISLITGLSRTVPSLPPAGLSPAVKLPHAVRYSLPGVTDHAGHHPEPWPLVLQDAGALSDGISGTRCCDGGQECNSHKDLTSNFNSIEMQSVIPDKQLLISNDCGDSDLLPGLDQLVVSEEGGGCHHGS